MTRQGIFKLGLLAGVFALAGAAAVPANSQDLPASGLAENETALPEGILLPAIIVSARKFEEPLQTVPFSLETFSSDQLIDANIEQTADLSRWVPNFNFSDNGLTFANMLNIRGIGSSSALIAPSINYYVDGVPVPVRVFDQRFLDVNSIDVLRGPQGTLFGLNSQAGAVVITTEEATADFAAGLTTEVGSYGHREVSGFINGQIAKGINARISAEGFGFDGDIRNVTFSAPNVVENDDRSVREEYYGALSAKVSAELSDTTQANFSLRYNRNEERPTTGVLLDSKDFPRNAYSPVPRSVVDTVGSSLEITHDFGLATFTSLTGLSHYRIDFEADLLDGFIMERRTGFPPSVYQTAGLNVREIDETSTQVSQEFRLNGEFGTDGNWVAGVSGLYSDFESTTDVTSQFIANGAYTGDLEKTNLAAFGEVTIPVADRLRLIAGARYTYENQDFSGIYAGRTSTVPNLASYSESYDSSFNFVTGRTGISFDLLPELTLYGTVARGEKPGGYLFYNQFASSGIPLSKYKSAETWTYEAGLRGQPVLDWLQVSASVFYNDTSNEQLFTFNPLSGRFDVLNADTESYGAEFSVIAAPINWFQFGANVGLLHAEITGGTNTALIGNDVPYAPDLTAALFTEVRHPFDLGAVGGELFGRAEYTYTGARQIDPANSLELDGYGLVNLRAGWQADRMEVFGYVENIFDESYTSAAYLTGTDTNGDNVFAGVPGTGRAFGLGARIRF